MTPKTQAEIILENYGLSKGAHAEGLAHTIERAIIAAVQEEREACAKIADREYISIQTVTMSDGYPEEGEGDCCADRCLIIRDRIRARSK